MAPRPGLPLQVGEHLAGGGFVPASGRHFDDMIVAVSVAGEVGARFVADALGPVLRGRQGGRLRLQFGAAIAGEPHPLSLDDLGVRR
jgi:hypothetical protein